MKSYSHRTYGPRTYSATSLHLPSPKQDDSLWNRIVQAAINALAFISKQLNRCKSKPKEPSNG
jgi:hypothetical protein